MELAVSTQEIDRIPIFAKLKIKVPNLHAVNQQSRQLSTDNQNGVYTHRTRFFMPPSRAHAWLLGVCKTPNGAYILCQIGLCLLTIQFFRDSNRFIVHKNLAASQGLGKMRTRGWEKGYDLPARRELVS